MKKLGLALYGKNGHQIHRDLAAHPRLELVAVAGFEAESLPPELGKIPSRPDLASLLEDPRVELISLCSPRRADQARDALRCLEAGRHVYAEKPCALREEDLDAILATARRHNLIFHEMAGTAWEQPYLAMREIVQAGTLGEIVQIFVQKSYPWHAGRPQDEDIDGGLTAQVGVHGVRMVEQVGLQKIVDIRARETLLGNGATKGGLRMAATLDFRLANGGLATVIANYLNQPGLGSWGNDHLRIFGTRGFVESVDGGQKTRLVVGKEDRGPLNLTRPGINYLAAIVAEILEQKPMPLTVEEELRPTRIVLRAREFARQNAA